MDKTGTSKRNQVIQGEAREILRNLPANSIQTCITSPPYWGLRDYDLPPTIWGGDAQCDHKWRQYERAGMSGGDGSKSTLTKGGDLYKDGVHAQLFDPSIQALCRHCGAWYGCLGLEPTIDQYVSNIVEVFREVRRVLRNDGTVFLNLGDSYAGSNKGIGKEKAYGGAKQMTNKGSIGIPVQDWSETDLKPKDLVMMPHRVALALQEDGWWVRNDIVWHKPSCMPESVRDRCTVSHEYIFLLAKSERYFYDQDAIREPWKDSSIARDQRGYNNTLYARTRIADPSDNRRSGIAGKKGNYSGRNKRSVWTISTKPFLGAHFAVFPPDLVRPCILAGTSAKGQCPECGMPWERTTEKETNFEGGSGRAGRSADKVNSSGKWAGKQYGQNIKLGPVIKVETTGWQPACDCHINLNTGEATKPSPPIPQIVLDPFGGAGTTGVVAKQLGRDYILIDLSEEYCEMARKRIAETQAGFPSMFENAGTLTQMEFGKPEEKEGPEQLELLGKVDK